MVFCTNICKIFETLRRACGVTFPIGRLGVKDENFYKNCSHFRNNNYIRSVNEQLHALKGQALAELMLYPIVGNQKSGKCFEKIKSQK